MKWPNVKLIFFRELRDQLRDRRTLFTVAVMPLLLYPLMGMAMLQVAQFMREYPAKVWLIGQENLPQTPALMVGEQANPEFLDTREQNLLEFTFSDGQPISWLDETNRLAQLDSDPELKQQIQHELKQRQVDLAVFFTRPNELNPDETAASPPVVHLFLNSASDKSQIGAKRVSLLINRWKEARTQIILNDYDVPATALQGLQIQFNDIADKAGKQSALWSKILPFIVVIWSLTGAFYPAIDLCAGEKERGTFETLLSSPAARSEIAIGKLLTVITFSMATSILNLLSMGFTGIFVMARLGSGAASGLAIGLPPANCVIWLLIALIPISALFSAVALAAAAFARSSKEGQYYLIPLMMISMPLMMIPMLPESKLDFGTSLIPVSGLMLLLRGLIEGQYAECLRYAAPVGMVTLAGCWLAVRWVVHQFNSETVLFRASERFNLGNWFRHVIRQRHDLPSLGSAVLCGLIILVAKFFIGLVAQAPESFGSFALQTVVILLATVAFPAIVMAMVLTKNPRKSLRLYGCSLPTASAAILAAICLNPLFMWLTTLVMVIYPPGNDLVLLEQSVSQILSSSPGLWAILLVFALAPAIFEEVAFRGFILSGMESLKKQMASHPADQFAIWHRSLGHPTIDHHVCGWNGHRHHCGTNPLIDSLHFIPRCA